MLILKKCMRDNKLYNILILILELTTRVLLRIHISFLVGNVGERPRGL